MREISFRDLSFEDKEDHVLARFLRIFQFRIPKQELAAISPYEIRDGKIYLERDHAERKLNLLIDKGFNELQNSASGKQAVYIHRNSAIPLIGSNAFGIVDRGTNLIEVKPVTGCNLLCIYCSVNDDRRVLDFVVEKDYLVEVFNQVASLKDEMIEAHIDSQGEPLYYADLVELTRDIAKNPNVQTISIDTNAMMLSKHKIDQLVDAGLTRFNISIDTLDQETAEHLAGCRYNLAHVKEMIIHASSKADVIITPLIVFGINDKHIDGVIQFAKEHGLKLGIQNYMSYKGGRNPRRKELPMDSFFEWLKTLEKKHGVELIISAEWFNIKKQKTLQKPFRKGEVVTAEVKCPGRLPGECIAVAQDRVITVSNCKKKGRIKAKITRTKHNIFYATLLS